MARNQQKQQREASEFEERVVFINRVAKTVKGGRRMSLVALVVVGDGKGNVGLGMGQVRGGGRWLSPRPPSTLRRHVPRSRDRRGHHSPRRSG